MPPRPSPGLARLPSRLLDGLTWLGFGAAILALAALTVSYIYEIVARYFFRAPTTWSSDVVGYALSATVFLALPFITAQGRHVAVTLVLDAVPRPVKSLMQRLIDAIGAGASFAAAWFSWTQNLRQFRLDILTLANDPIPKWWITGLITAGLVLCGLHFLRHLFARDNLAPTPFAEIDL